MDHTDTHATGAAHAAHHQAVVRGHVVAEQRRMPGRGNAGGVVDVFQRERNAVQRTAITAGGNVVGGLARSGAREVCGHGDECIQLRVEVGDAFEQRFRIFKRREFVRGNQRGRFSDGEEVQVGCHAHDYCTQSKGCRYVAEAVLG